MDYVDLLLDVKEGDEVRINNLRLKVTKVTPVADNRDGKFVIVGHDIFLKDPLNEYHVYASHEKSLVLEMIQMSLAVVRQYRVLKSETVREVSTRK